jgi:hypothetical protein
MGVFQNHFHLSEEVVKLIMSWRLSGFNVHCGPRIQPGDEEAMENLARYVVRASFSQDPPASPSIGPNGVSNAAGQKTRAQLSSPLWTALAGREDDIPSR